MLFLYFDQMMMTGVVLRMIIYGDELMILVVMRLESWIQIRKIDSDRVQGDIMYHLLKSGRMFMTHYDCHEMLQVLLNYKIR